MTNSGRAGVQPSALLNAVRAEARRLDEVLDSRDQEELEAVLSMDLGDVRDELRSVGVETEALTRRILSQIPVTE